MKGCYTMVGIICITKLSGPYWLYLDDITEGIYSWIKISVDII